MATMQKSLVILVDENDMWQDAHLYAAIVMTLERQGIAGATVNLGLMGYGRHRRIHRKGLFGMADDKPVTVIAVDTEEKIRAVLPIVTPMIREGLVFLHDVEVISTGHAQP